MAQPSVTSFFNTRKRAAIEDISSIKNKRLLDANVPSEAQQDDTSQEVVLPSQSIQPEHKKANAKVLTGVQTRSSRTSKRAGNQHATNIPNKLSRIEQSIKQPKLVQFIKKGPLTPQKKPVPSTECEIQLSNEQTPSSTNVGDSSTLLHKAFDSQKNDTNIELGLKTPTKQIIKGSATPHKWDGGELKSLVRKELNFDEVKTKLTRSSKLQELKASLARIKELEQARKEQEELNRRLRDGLSSPATQKTPTVQLQQFKTIELEVLSSPAKTFKTPTKLPPPTPDKNELMSPRHTAVSKRVLFSPAKAGSPSKLIVPPAYQRYMNLAGSTPAGKLPLPYKYRHLIELFKGVDSVCAMFYNRKECITFKKLKPAVQRMLRKNFTEMHLAQIKHVYPEAYVFTQMKMRNYGSTSKADYFQLLISPNVANGDKESDEPKKKIDEDNVLTAASSSAMNPQVMTERFLHFQTLLLRRVQDEHDKFLRSLDPPLLIPKHKVTRWHPEFDLEKCPDIEMAHIPQPPNVEKYSSARDILSTARNLFNCATPMERAIERYENFKNSATPSNVIAKEESAATITESNVKKQAALATSEVPSTPVSKATPSVQNSATTTYDANSTLLKGIPKSLLERIRAKQAAKALDTMTRRPSQDQETTKYSRLPELARHLRNVFITERKSVLTLELVIKKIQNSFRTCLTPQEVEAHLRLMAKEVPSWVSFHEVRKTMYVKIVKDMDLTKIVEQLENAANEKSK